MVFQGLFLFKEIVTYRLNECPGTFLWFFIRELMIFVSNHETVTLITVGLTVVLVYVLSVLLSLVLCESDLNKYLSLSTRSYTG